MRRATLTSSAVPQSILLHLFARAFCAAIEPREYLGHADGVLFVPPTPLSQNRLPRQLVSRNLSSRDYETQSNRLLAGHRSHRVRAAGRWNNGLGAWANRAGCWAPVVEVLEQLGYPVYLLTILGIWKLLGSIALTIPRFPRLQEWAYAGIFFEMTGAAASWIAIGDQTGEFVAPLMFAAFAMTSWVLRPQQRQS